MISHQHKCIMVQVSKAASTSMLTAFRSNADDHENGDFGFLHYPIKHYLDTCPDQFDEYFKFGFVRNPWDRLYSQYKYLRYTRKEEHAQCDFSDWLRKCFDAVHSGTKVLFGRNHSIFVLHMTDQLGWFMIDDVLRVDFIGRFENLAEDFRFVSNALNVALELPHVNRSKSADTYQHNYDGTSIELVAQLHARDIERFGYQF